MTVSKHPDRVVCVFLPSPLGGEGRNTETTLSGCLDPCRGSRSWSTNGPPLYPGAHRLATAAPPLRRRPPRLGCQPARRPRSGATAPRPRGPGRATPRSPRPHVHHALGRSHPAPEGLPDPGRLPGLQRRPGVAWRSVAFPVRLHVPPGRTSPGGTPGRGPDRGRPDQAHADPQRLLSRSVYSHPPHRPGGGPPRRRCQRCPRAWPPTAQWLSRLLPAAAVPAAVRLRRGQRETAGRLVAAGHGPRQRGGG